MSDSQTSPEITASGHAALSLATELLHRVRVADATAGVWEAADLHWWWRSPRPSDELDQLFWLDDEGPMAAVLLTWWRHGWGLDIVVAPDERDRLAEVVRAATDRIDELRLERVETAVRDDDKALMELLTRSGFVPTDDRSAVMWMDAADRHAVPDLPDGFRLVDRARERYRPHWLETRSGPVVERRLNEVPLYDPELDVAILAPTGAVAGYALFWFDSVTRVGLVEPLRTEEGWQRRGLARTMVAHEIERLVRRGATRLKIGFTTPAAKDLYLGLGFRVDAALTTWHRLR